MNPVVLEYHDVVPGDQRDSSGFPGVAARSYKLEISQFEDHLRRLKAAGLPVGSARGSSTADGCVWFTFDDGGASALVTADALERHGWRGHFLMATDYIGTPAFCTAEALRDLHARGHVVGSHSCSHPLRMSACSDDQLTREWQDSVARLADVLGTPPHVASVPGGGYSRRVARSAAEAGIRILFTSEPTIRQHTERECVVFGRYTLRDVSTAADALALASGEGWARARQWTWWNAKKVAKAAGGPIYLRLREILMTGRDR